MTSLMRRKGNIVTETHASKFPKVKVLYNGKHNRLFSQLKFFPHIITDSETRRKIEYTTTYTTRAQIQEYLFTHSWERHLSCLEEQNQWETHCVVKVA